MMGQLAREGKMHGLRVAVTTTTHICKPPLYREAFSAVKTASVVVFGKECGAEKLSYPGDDCYRKLCSEADLILVEADGSRGRPIKYPAEHEPVIPENTDLILCVCGMSGFGKPGREICHRWELAAERWEAEMPGEILMTENVILELLERGYGGPLEQKYPRAEFFYCLNQADTKERYEAAVSILAKTKRKGLVVSLKEKDNILYQKAAFIYMASGFGRRYGSNKLLEMVEGKPLFYHGLEVLAQAAEQLKEEVGIAVEIVVVSQYQEILETAGRREAVAVYNGDSMEGITASIRLGIQAAGEADAYLFAVADQPWLTAASIGRLVKEFYDSPRTIACLACGKMRGNPVIFSGKYREELLGLTGDKGGSVILARYPQEVQTVQVEALELKDIDRRGE